MIHDNSDSIEKVAYLVKSFGEDISSAVLRYLDEDERKIIMSYSGQNKYDSENEDIEFLDYFYKQCIYHQSAQENASISTLSDSFGEERIQKISEKIKKIQNETGYSISDKIDNNKLISIIRGEHPQIAALILSLIPFSKAANIITTLPLKIQLELIERIEKTGEISVNVIETICLVFNEHL